MPVRSSRSSVLKWPDRETVDRAIREWAAAVTRQRQDVLAIAYVGSYARGDWGVGSDVDLLIVVAASEQPFHRRALEFDTRALPVPADVLVYTVAEWRTMARGEGRLWRVAEQEGVWVKDARDEIEVC
ncbi:MAG: nucleotidyltransferase domain-containing protein [Armatimonadota bacterium]|nr:nucleotidyltransferase domain-containing protein [Armatimonadota bacterium]